jgi:hypothetical protein
MYVCMLVYVYYLLIAESLVLTYICVLVEIIHFFDSLQRITVSLPSGDLIPEFIVG